MKRNYLKLCIAGSVMGTYLDDDSVEVIRKQLQEDMVATRENSRIRSILNSSGAIMLQYQAMYVTAWHLYEVDEPDSAERMADNEVRRQQLANQKKVAELLQQQLDQGKHGDEWKDED